MFFVYEHTNVSKYIFGLHNEEYLSLLTPLSVVSDYFLSTFCSLLSSVSHSTSKYWNHCDTEADTASMFHSQTKRKLVVGP